MSIKPVAEVGEPFGEQVKWLDRVPPTGTKLYVALPFEDDGIAPEDRNGDVLDVINRMDRIMRDQTFPIERRIHDLEHIAAFALRFRDHLSQLKHD
jgi:hypothetical protein